MPDRERIESLRLFVAVPLWEGFRAGALDRYKELRKRDWPLKWVKPENWHLTLKFLGETPESAVELIAMSIHAHVSERFQPFQIEIGGLGGFPRLSKMRVFWVGIRQGKEPLIDLAQSVHKACVEAGFPGDKKKFEPHLTLARARVGPIAVDVPKEVYSGSWGTERVDGIALVKSDLGPGGVKYEVLKKISL